MLLKVFKKNFRWDSRYVWQVHETYRVLIPVKYFYNTNQILKLVVLCMISIQNNIIFIKGLINKIYNHFYRIKPIYHFNNRFKRYYTPPYGKLKKNELLDVMIPYFEKNYMQEHNLSFIDKENDLNFIKRFGEFKKFVKINCGHEKFYDIKIISDENGEDIVTFIGYDFSSNTSSIYWFGEENKKIEILDIFKNTGKKDSISEIGIKFEVNLTDFEKVIEPSDLEKLKKWGISKGEMKLALDKVSETINQLKDRKIYNLNKGGKIEKYASSFEGQEVVTTEELLKKLRDDDII